MDSLARMSTLQTPRLTLVPWPEQHTEFVSDYQRDPVAMRYLGNGQPWVPERFDEVCEWQAEHWATRGYGWRVALDRDGGEPLALATSGVVGPGVPDLDPEDHELGWWVVATAWRQGYGTEIGRALRAEAHEVLGAPSVLARLQPENLGSEAIAHAIGLTYERDIRGRFGELNAVYRGSAEEWAAKPT